MAGSPPRPGSVAIVTLGCARNEVDSEELAGRLDAAGFSLVEDPQRAATVLVNTCGFIESARKDSVDSLLAVAGDGGGRERAVVAVGCLAERYGDELAAALPEADAVLGFDDYPHVAERLRAVLAGLRPQPPVPRDRRRALPLAPAERAEATPRPAPVRHRLSGGPVAPLKLASGCDRRCSFCAIPRFRGSFVSRPPADVLAEAAWLVEQGVRELFMVSENTTSYGKDLGDLRLLESLLPRLAALPGLARVRLSYLQPAELRPGLIEALTATAGVVPYFDLSFQHASAPLLRRMRRFGSTERFLELLADVRRRCPSAGVRSNVIVGFPGETEDDVAELERFLGVARLDVVGVFGYSAEDGTEAAGLPGQLPADLVAERVERVTSLVDELVAQRAEDRVGEVVEVLVEGAAGQRAESTDDAAQVDGAGRPGGGQAWGRAAHQGPEVDGTTTLVGAAGAAVGDVVRARVTGTDGADLLAEALEAVR